MKKYKSLFRRAKKYVCLTLLLVLSSYLCFAQKGVIDTTNHSLNQNNLKISLLVYCDYIDYHDTVKNLQTIVDKYKIQNFLIDEISSFSFFKVNKIGNSCTYYLAYNSQNDIYYKLQGFKTNDFKLFYDDLLMNEPIVSLEYFNKCKIANTTIGALYDLYYNNCQNRLDDVSCCAPRKFTFYKPPSRISQKRKQQMKEK